MEDDSAHSVGTDKAGPAEAGSGAEETAFSSNGRIFTLDVDESEKEATFWWWWILFFDPPHSGADPAQLTVMCTSRNTRAVTIDTMPWVRKGGIEFKEGKGWFFPGMTLAWYYDGTTMHDPLVRMGDRYRLDPDRHRLRSASGALKAWEDDSAFHLRLGAGSDLFKVDLTPIDDPSMDFLRTPVDDSNVIMGKFEYRITEIFRARVKGRLRSGDSSDGGKKGGEKGGEKGGKKGGEKGGEAGGESCSRLLPRGLSGTAYFQRVSLRSPAPPWYWAIVHFPDGSFLNYMQPRLSGAMLNTDPPGGQMKERLSIPLSHNIEFYNARENTRYVFKKMNVKKWYERNRPSNLPLFRISGRSAGRKGENIAGARIAITLESLAQADWRFQKGVERPKKKGGPHGRAKRKDDEEGRRGPVLVYNEYPARVVSFEFAAGGQRLDLEDLGGSGRANCEDVWGMMW